jgi:hypothetical protein
VQDLVTPPPTRLVPNPVSQNTGNESKDRARRRGLTFRPLRARQPQVETEVPVPKNLSDAQTSQRTDRVPMLHSRRCPHHHRKVGACVNTTEQDPHGLSSKPLFTSGEGAFVRIAKGACFTQSGMSCGTNSNQEWRILLYERKAGFIFRFSIQI